MKPLVVSFPLAILLLATVLSPSTARRQLTDLSPSATPWSDPGDDRLRGPFAHRDFVIPSIVCKEEGPCRNKRLACPAKCFKTWTKEDSRGGLSSGRDGGCTFDCKACTSFC